MLNGSTPIISNCNIISNTASHTGGGIHVDGSSPVIEDNVIEFNHNGGCYGGGGISFIYNSSGLVQNNLIAENTANYYGAYGGFAR